MVLSPSALLNAAQAPIARGLLALPPRVVRRLAGPPVVKEGRTLDPEMQLVLRLQAAAGKPAEELPLAHGRASIVAGSELVGGKQAVGRVADRTIAGPGGDLHLRVYTPRGVGAAGPGLFFIHGGGWIYGDLRSHDAVCRFLAERTGARVVAVDYRLAPEHPFPAAVDDSWAVWTWLAEHGHELGINTARLAVGGDSAGGNLAAVVSQKAVRDGALVPAFQLLIYPATDFAETRPSRHAFSEGFFLSAAFIDLAKRHYTLSDPDVRDWRLSPLHGELEGQPPAHVVTAGFDPLVDEGRAYADALRAAGVEVTYRCEEGLIHSFANMVGIGRSGPAAMARAAEALRLGLARA
ncbi:alpha/beta hydrolase [Solicola sp. PLA-1-18]|uniref:alpha/beta hydrolase n=1 Tax=Solicola sp. PLA-1-18 TaxID=3380532 RepID=UPI003B802C69